MDIGTAPALPSSDTTPHLALISDSILPPTPMVSLLAPWPTTPLTYQHWWWIRVLVVHTCGHQLFVLAAPIPCTVTAAPAAQTFHAQDPRSFSGRAGQDWAIRLLLKCRLYCKDQNVLKSKHPVLAILPAPDLSGAPVQNTKGYTEPV